jgi:hypothetical protein
MNTNTVQIVTQAANSFGYALNYQQVLFIYAIIVAIGSHFWGAVKFWAHVQGMDGIRRFFKTGSTVDRPPSLPKG